MFINIRVLRLRNTDWKSSLKCSVLHVYAQYLWITNNLCSIKGFLFYCHQSLQQTFHATNVYFSLVKRSHQLWVTIGRFQFILFPFCKFCWLSLQLCMIDGSQNLYYFELSFGLHRISRQQSWQLLSRSRKVFHFLQNVSFLSNLFECYQFMFCDIQLQNVSERV